MTSDDNNTQELKLVTGKSYHVKGWNHKAVFILQGIVNGVATLSAPKYRKITHAPASKLFYTAKTKKELL